MVYLSFRASLPPPPPCGTPVLWRARARGAPRGPARATPAHRPRAPPHSPLSPGAGGDGARLAGARGVLVTNAFF